MHTSQLLTRLGVLASLSTLGLAVVLAGCDRKAEAPPIAPVASRPLSDPLGLFQEILRPCQAVLGGSAERVWQAPTGKWVRNKFIPKSLSFDVKRTDSLVSPYVAYMDVRYFEATDIDNSEQAVKALTVPNKLSSNVDQHWVLKYAFRDGKWQQGEVDYSFAFPDLNIAESAPKSLRFEDLVEVRPDATACAVPAT
ncbi:hypothetical protein H6P1_00490 (plasmid) [Variovorax sp. PBL-H6]|nr:hypothetical protein SRS16P1_00416 [Variovorax sp. SRS16]VTU43048.1 hypothetical protein E5P1_00414 [Variovorax sp. PBL-E5]VTU43512.1 hypothetical protein H6P1_00490 [Variovorax sp. PBL-H6]